MTRDRDAEVDKRGGGVGKGEYEVEAEVMMKAMKIKRVQSLIRFLDLDRMYARLSTRKSECQGSTRKR